MAAPLEDIGLATNQIASNNFMPNHTTLFLSEYTLLSVGAFNCLLLKIMIPKSNSNTLGCRAIPMQEGENRRLVVSIGAFLFFFMPFHTVEHISTRTLGSLTPFGLSFVTLIVMTS